jgi:hypothetical protein
VLAVHENWVCRTQQRQPVLGLVDPHKVDEQSFTGGGLHALPRLRAPVLYPSIRTEWLWWLVSGRFDVSSLDGCDWLENRSGG